MKIHVVLFLCVGYAFLFLQISLLYRSVSYNDVAFTAAAIRDTIRDSVTLEIDPGKDDDLLINTPECKILNTSNVVMKPPKRQKCPGPVVGIDEDGIIKVTKHGQENFVTCCYREIFRVERNYNGNKSHPLCDWETRSTDCTQINAQGAKLSAPYVRVECLTKSKSEHVEFLSTVLPLPPLSKSASTRAAHWSKLPAESHPPSILFITIAGVSRLHSFRALPKTREFALNNDFIELRGFNKIGSTGYANMMAMLQGTPDCVSNPQTKSLDDCAFVWKNLTELRYLTGIVEDSPSLSIFNYLKIGFCKQPVDYYPRTVMTAAHVYLKGDDQHALPRNCFNGETLFGTIFNYTHRFLRKIAGKAPYFLLAGFRTLPKGLMELVHEDANFVQLLQELIYNPDYHGNNTIIFLHSTHGQPFYPNFQSFYEEGLPMFFIRLPPTLKASHPHWDDNLKLNSQRLTTSTDVFKTLQDVISLVTNKSKPNSYSDGSYSLFEPIPPNRSCESARIPGLYCRCGAVPIIKPAGELIRRLANALVDHVNQLLIPVSDHNLCTKLSVSKILSGRMLNKGFIRSSYGQTVQFADYRVAVEVFPSGANFQADIRSIEFNSSLRVLGNLTRINQMGNQSFCISDERLKPFCCCMEVAVRLRISKIKEYMKWSAYAPPKN